MEQFWTGFLNLLEPLVEQHGILKDIFTVVAILVGGIWSYLLFVRKRQKFPRANISHKITHKPIDDNKVLLHLDVGISNAGDVLISIISGIVRLHQIVPAPDELLSTIRSGNDPISEEKNEYDWPLIAEREPKWEKRNFEIEPGETDHANFDFIIDNDIETIEIYTYLKNKKKRFREIGWNLTTIYDLRPQKKGETDDG